MSKSSKPQIFISHASDDSKMANLIKEILVGSLRLPNREKIFVSSDEESIRLDDIQYERITTALQSSKIVLALITPNSVHRPWVLFEAGGAHFFGKSCEKKLSKSLFLLCANGIKPESLPAPLKPREAKDLRDRNVVSQLCREIVGRKNGVESSSFTFR